MLKKNLPLIEYEIDPENDSFVSAISLVEYPAIESNFIAFSTDQKLINFSTNDEKKELIGIAMIPNVPIYRVSDNNVEYAGVFSAETIRLASQIFAKKGLFNNTNINHSIIPANSYVYQSYIVDSVLGMTAPIGLEKAIDGSWVIVVKVLSDTVWQSIKEGKINGFSVEAILKLLDTNSTVNLQLSQYKPLSKYDQKLRELEAFEALMNIISRH
jgi:hypothetical protein